MKEMCRTSDLLTVLQRTRRHVKADELRVISLIFLTVRVYLY